MKFLAVFDLIELTVCVLDTDSKLICIGFYSCIKMYIFKGNIIVLLCRLKIMSLFFHTDQILKIGKFLVHFLGPLVL